MTADRSYFPAQNKLTARTVAVIVQWPHQQFTPSQQPPYHGLISSATSSHEREERKTDEKEREQGREKKADRNKVAPSLVGNRRVRTESLLTTPGGACRRQEKGRMNNNMTTERAVLGVFAPTSYISFGDKVRDNSFFLVFF